MGMYNIYDEVQLKVADELTLQEFSVGDMVDIEDGVYVGLEGVVVVCAGLLIGRFDFDLVFDKWGNKLPLKDLVDKRNPVHKAIKRAIKKSKQT